MPEARVRAQSGGDDEFGMGSLVRVASWGIGAAAALFLAIVAALSSPRSLPLNGPSSGQTLARSHTAATSAAAVNPTRPELQATPEVRLLAEQVRLLAADRDRVLQRLSAVEHDLDDVTGSIKQQQSAPQPAATPPAAASPSPVAPMAAAAALWSVTASHSRQ